MDVRSIRECEIQILSKQYKNGRYEERISIDFEELRDDLFRDAAELVSEVPSTNIAIFVSPPPGYEKDISTCSFGYPSAEAVFKKFLEENEEEKVGLSSPRGWWNDAMQLQTMNMEDFLAVRAQLTSLKIQVILKSKSRSTADGSSENLEDEPKP